MTIGPDEDGAELYSEHLESIPCPTCGARESEFAHLRARVKELEEEKEKAEGRIIKDRDGKMVSQGAFNAMEYRYYLYGERMVEAEGALCRAKEAFAALLDSRNDIDETRALTALNTALSSSAPCPHAARVKELEEENGRLREVIND